ncbi:glycosyltransferase family 4 protein [Catenibacterium sp.]|uniref:glycosyltransferase family 4 protein n=1 Tax=Catenibacterium sp. TaxID=2049022 RepID=UPI003FD7B27E
MNILYFASVDFYQKPNPSFHLMYSMITDLLESNNKINYVGLALEGIEQHIPIEFINNPNFSYDLIDMPNTKKSSFVKRYIDGIKYAVAAKKHIKKMINDSDVIFIQSSPTALYNISVVKRFVKDSKKIIYNVQDMFPGSSIASGVMPQKWMQIVFSSLQKIAYRKSDIIVAISDDMKDKLIEQGVPNEKIEVIVNWFDDRTVSEVSWDKNRFVKIANMDKEHFYVQYAGTMGYVFDYHMIIKVAEILQDDSKIIFQMIGEGSQKQEFVKTVKEKQLNNIVFLPLQPQDMVSDVYSACSTCIIPLKHGVIGNSVPSKAGLLMACKRSIVTSTDKGSKYNSMIKDNGIGFAFGDNEPEKMAEAILKLSKNTELCKHMGIKGYEFGHKLYSRAENMKKYVDLFERMLSEGGRL